MKSIEAFEIWAPSESVWSRWAKPILFAEMNPTMSSQAERSWPTLDQKPDGRTAVIVDLPGEDSVETGIALAQCGFQPVPLYNSASGPNQIFGSRAIVDVEPVKQLLLGAAAVLSCQNLAPDSPPAFLLDSNRCGNSVPVPGKFDNRSIVFPQDFPSANFLRSHGIQRVVLFQGTKNQPSSDLAHVLVRWQETGIQISRRDSDPGSPIQVIKVLPPSRFRSIWYRALALMGLRRNSAGGFGSVVPQPSSGVG
jgi:hypothetical protein